MLSNLDWAGTGLALPIIYNEAKGGGFLMKIEIPFLAALLLAGTSLMVRAQAQGIEQAVFSMGMEYGLNLVSAGMRLLPNTARFGW
jgi:hypothetical protein